MAKKGSPDDANPEGERSAAPFVPKTTSVRSLSAAAHQCRGCDLYKTATQVVFGAGPAKARVMFVGEQPGDQEDRQGEPFVGPAGALLDKALEEAGIPRADVYVTNAVKHFKWEPRGKRRIHKKPRASEIKACRPWLEAELRAVKPQILVCLGATAAQSVLGSQFKLMQNRGKLLDTAAGPKGPALPGRKGPALPGRKGPALPGRKGPALPVERVVATIHPSAVLRAPDSEGRRAAYESLVADLKVVAKTLRSTRA
jgi:DNA polymerase